MAKFYVTCDVEDYQSHVENIKTWLTEKGHEEVSSNMSNDEDVHHIDIDCDDIIVKKAGRPISSASAADLLGNKIKMANGLYLTRRPEDEKPIEERIESVCESLNKTLLYS